MGAGAPPEHRSIPAPRAGLDRLLAAAVGILGLAGALWLVAGAAALRTASPTLYVAYQDNCTFTLTLDGGAPAATIPPGTYQVFVSTPFPFGEYPPPDCEYPKFQLTGPGVNLTTDLSSGGETTAQLTATFAPSSTYVAVDGQQPVSSRRTFATSAPASAAPPSPSPSPVSSSGGKTGSTAPAAPSLDIVGSALTPKKLRGTLDGIVPAHGALTLTMNGKRVMTLKSGRYAVAVEDRSSTSGFVLQEVRRTWLTVTSTAFVGRRKVTVDLTAGQWFFYPTFTGKKTYFIVVNG